MNLLGMVSGGNFREVSGNDPFMMRGKVSESELAIAQNIHLCKAGNPGCLNPGQPGDGL